MEIDKLAVALVKAQKEIKTAKKETENIYFKSKYADLASVWEACREALSNNNIAVVQSGLGTGTQFFLRTTLLHSSGQSLYGDYLVSPEKPGPQALGSAWTYSRRYSLAAMVGVISEDDDAEAATDRKEDIKAVAIKPMATEISGDVYKKIFVPTALSTKDGAKNGKSWTIYSLKDQQGDWYTTFDEAIFELANHSKQSGEPLTVSFVLKGEYKNIVGCEVAVLDKVEL